MSHGLRKWSTVLLGCIVGVGLTSACSSKTSNAGTGGSGGTSACVPGKQYDCKCLDGSIGFYACNQEGTGFGPCHCGSADAGSSGGSGGTAGQPPNDCCSPHFGPGCSDPSIQGCVCNLDKICCDQAWDPVCVGEVNSLGCGTCSGTDGGEPACNITTGVGDCCEPKSTAGCSSQDVSMCVCEVFGFANCCNQAWDMGCVNLLGPELCGPPPR